MQSVETNLMNFLAAKRRSAEDAKQEVSCLLLAGVDLKSVLGAPAPERRRQLARIIRLLERERLKGLRRHWSYDLNRHIGLKGVHDRLAATLKGGQTTSHRTKKAPPEGRLSDTQE